MLKHILLLRFSPEYKGEKLEETVADLKKRFSALAADMKHDGLISIELGQNVNGGEFDIALVSLFTEETALQRYQVHPIHMEIKEQMNRYVVRRACVDYQE